MRQRKEEKPESSSRPTGAESTHVVPQNQEQSFEISTFLLNAGITFIKRHKKLSGAYFIGLLVMIFATGVSVSMEHLDKYSEAMEQLGPETKLMKDLRTWQESYIAASHEHQKHKGWFNCDRECVKYLKKKMYAEHKVAQIKYEIKQHEAAAKSHLGVFSEHSVQETRELFWKNFAGGKEFSQSTSWFDLIFMGIDSMGRDEHIAAFLIRFLLQLALNFTMGMIGAFIGFWWQIGAVVSSYSPGFIGGWVFYFLALLAAFSMITSFLIMLYFSAAGTVYVAAKVAGPEALLQAGRPRRRVAYRRF